MANIVDYPLTPEALELDMPVETALEKVDDEIHIPLFRPGDAGLKRVDIDGIGAAGEMPVTVAHYLVPDLETGDGTAVGGCSFMIHVGHAAVAIASGLCETVLITHGESGRSGVGRTRNVVPPTLRPLSLAAASEVLIASGDEAFK